jgi:DUF1680 family protein
MDGTRIRPDALQPPAPDAVQMKGLLGQRYDLSCINRLHHQEDDHLLFAFQLHVPLGYNNADRPREEIHGDWQGEFIGTWTNAAVLTAWNKGDEQLSQKVRRLVKDWIATQEDDGYLGTYNREDRWESWDLWIHAHDLIGLISYYHYTGDKAVLDAAIRAADCVLREFGPGKRAVYPTGPWGGMASSAILEPMIWLYFETGGQRYLDFGKWLVDVDWEQPGGPRTVSILRSGGEVADIAGGKGIEMLTNFAGLVELYRATGDERYHEAVTKAWEDIVKHQLYITGTSSAGELFSKLHLLPNDTAYWVGETCVSMGWMYLNFSLGRLTGDARFFDMAEQVIYNHLLAAQSPDGKGWAYYLGLRDQKRYRWHTDPECCPSRGVRALAQFPQHVYAIDHDGFRVNLYEASTARLTLAGGQRIDVVQESQYPFDGTVRLRLDSAPPGSFSIQLRLPGWCTSWQLHLNGTAQAKQPNEAGYLVLSREWHAGDTITLSMAMPVRVVMDRLGNPGRVALVRGPLVYSADSAYLADGVLLDDIVLRLDSASPVAGIGTVTDPPSGHVHLIVPGITIRANAGPALWREGLRYHDIAGRDQTEEAGTVRFVPFFDAGNRDTDCYRSGYWTNSKDPAKKITYQAWLPYVCQTNTGA